MSLIETFVILLRWLTDPIRWGCLILSTNLFLYMNYQQEQLSDMMPLQQLHVIDQQY